MNRRLKLHKVLKLSYDNNEQHQQNMKKNGYAYDSMLSSKNEKVYYNPTQNKLLVSVAGTDKFSPQDIITDVYLGLGKLQDTSRYKHAHQTIRDAKKKYNVNNATLAGHSLGGSIVSYAGSKGDTIYTHLTKNMTTLGSNNYLKDGVVMGALKAHNVSNIKQNKIYI